MDQKLIIIQIKRTKFDSRKFLYNFYILKKSIDKIKFKIDFDLFISFFHKFHFDKFFSKMLIYFILDLKIENIF